MFKIFSCVQAIPSSRVDKLLPFSFNKILVRMNIRMVQLLDLNRGVKVRNGTVPLNNLIQGCDRASRPHNETPHGSA